MLAYAGWDEYFGRGYEEKGEAAVGLVIRLYVLLELQR